MKTFSVLNPALLSQLDEFNIMQKATKLQEDYPDDLSFAFPIQLSCFRASMKTEIDNATSVKDLAKMLIVDYMLHCRLLSRMLPLHYSYF
jgi:hypothetical protein